MADDAQTRKLATIVALDVAGYSARTEADETKSTAEIASLRPVIEEIAARHAGRVFNTAGDGFMLEFGSSLSAAEAAFELAEKCEPKVRVGVHAGDVIQQPNGDLLGHGVNVASRLMVHAVPGSVLLSADVKHMMRGPLVQSLRSKGTIKLAKMSETIEVFAFLPEAPVRQGWRALANSLWTRVISRSRPRVVLASIVLMAFVAIAAWMLIAPAPPAIPQSPVANATPDASIAVMPFENLSTDKDNAFFAAGIQDEILTRLTKIGSLKVISRTSTAHMASRPDNLPEIAKQLGVATILEGSVQRQGNSVRVNVQLIKAATDGHLWAEVYDRKLDNIFEVQSEIAISIANALSAKVTGKEKQSLTMVPTTSPDAYDAYLRGLTQIFRGSPRMDVAIKSFQEAVRLDPEFALAWAFLARTQSNFYFDSEGTNEQRAAAQLAVDTALRLAPELLESQLAQGFYTYYVDHDYEGARQQFERVHAKWPNNAETLHALGLIARRQGRWSESKVYFEQELSFGGEALQFLAGAQAVARDFNAALKTQDRFLHRYPDSVSGKTWKVYYLQSVGRVSDAAALLSSVQPGPEDQVQDFVFKQALLERRYESAIATLHRLAGQEADNPDLGDLRLYLGRLRSLSGDEKLATEDLKQARAFYLARLDRRRDNPSLLAGLAMTYCYLADRKNALKYIESAIALEPATKDSWRGPPLEDTRMRIWSNFGDRELAIPEIARLLNVPYPGAITPVMLRLEPDFDKLRGDPRFEALANSDLKPK